MILVLALSIISVFSGGKGNKSEEFKEVERKLSKEEETIIKECQDKLNDKNYKEAKEINYKISMLFNKIRNDELENIKLFPDYLEFLDMSSSEYINYKYKNMSDEMFFYEIVNVRKMKEYEKTLVDIKHKYKDENLVTFKTFSLEDGYLLDEPFLFIKDIGKNASHKGIDFFIDKKAIFDDKAVYKIKIKNNREDTFFISEDKFGFYAGQDKNKYGYNILFGDLSSYRVRPNAEEIFYISFENLRGIADIYIVIDGEDVFLTTN